MNDILEFTIPNEATSQKWAIYIIVAENNENNLKLLYVGKVGDNRIGCNPIISRIGNHFSLNQIHSQMRNKLNNYSEKFNYRIFCKQFNDYNEREHKENKDKINEFERLLNKYIQEIIINFKDDLKLLNQYKGKISIAKSNQRLDLTSIEEKKEIYEFAQSIIEKVLPTTAVSRNGESRDLSEIGKVIN